MPLIKTLQLAWRTLVKPKTAAECLKEDGNTWLPLLVLFAVLYALFTTYFNHIDIDWYREQATASLADKFAPDRLAEIKASMQPSNLRISLTIAVFLENLLIFVLFAFYLHVVTHDRREKALFFADWWRLAVWSAWPKILSLLVATLYISMQSNTQLPLDKIQPLSANAWFDDSMSNVFKILLSLANPFELWSLALAVVFYQRWTKASLAKSLIIILAPHALFIGYQLTTS